MGHLGLIKDEYRAFTKRLESGTASMPEPESPEAWEGWKEILEILLTPEQAALAARLPVKPASLRRLAERLQTSEDALKPKLDALCDRGIVMDLVSRKTGKTLYLLSPPVVGFFEFSLMRVKDTIPQDRISRALEAYGHADRAFVEEIFSRPTTIGRAMVHEDRIAADVSEVLVWERATSLLEKANLHAVSTCYCRHKAAHLGEPCDSPTENCLSLDGAADFITRRKFGREISRGEALEILTRSRDKGLVQIADNVQSRAAYVCNCCGCCCGQLQSINKYGLKGVTPSGFEARSTPEKCSGCSRCARACPVGAITMEPKRGKASVKASLSPRIDLEACIGCGVCAGACKKDSMKMVRRETRPDVPSNALDKVIRMSLERGRLADLLFDEGAGRGWRFLNSCVQALAGLPGAQRTLASRQVRSRFVRYALATVGDPTE